MMKLTMSCATSHVKRLTIVFMPGLLLGCASMHSQSHDDQDASQKSQAYLESAQWIADADWIPSGLSCELPAEFNQPPTKEAVGPSKDWKPLVERSKTCIHQKNWKTLEALGTTLARIDMDSPWGSYFLSLAAQGRGEFQRALWMADMAQKKSGGKSGLFAYQKGRVLYAMKETRLAMKQMQAALKLDSHLAEADYFLAQIHHRDLEEKEAIAAYQACVDENPKHYGALVALADLRLAQSAGDESVKLLRAAIVAHPERLTAWVKLGSLYETVKKDPSLALETYKELKTLVDGGSVRQRPDFDLKEKIKTLESEIGPRVPAQQSASQSTVQPGPGPVIIKK